LKKLAGGGQGQSSIRVPAPGLQLHIREAAVDVIKRQIAAAALQPTAGAILSCCAEGTPQST
jgi:hypothetical protein